MSTIKSNIDGIILKAPENEGETIIKGIPFLIVSDVSNLVAEIQIPEKHANSINIGQNAKITGEAFDETLKGIVYDVMPYAKASFDILGQSQKVTVDAKLLIENATPNVILGSSIEATIIVDEKNDVIVIPYEAIFQEEKIEYVHVLENNIAVKKEITTGYELENDIEVVGINEDEIIILTQDIKTGQKVRYE